MKQSNFKMKKLCSETLKTLINELNRPGNALLRNFSEKNYLYYSILNTDCWQREDILCFTQQSCNAIKETFWAGNKKSLPDNF